MKLLAKLIFDGNEEYLQITALMMFTIPNKRIPKGIND